MSEGKREREEREREREEREREIERRGDVESTHFQTLPFSNFLLNFLRSSLAKLSSRSNKGKNSPSCEKTSA